MEPVGDLELARKLFLFTHPDAQETEKDLLKEEISGLIVVRDMPLLYETLVAEGLMEEDDDLVDSLRDENEKELKRHDEYIAFAEETLSETDVREAHLEKCFFFMRICVKDKALEQLELTRSMTIGLGNKMDLVFYTLQVGFFHMDFDVISETIDREKSLFEESADWERKNRFKVYEGLFCMSTRNFNAAASLFLESISTFTAEELFSYETCIFYTVLTNIISVDRLTLKQKVVDAPEILSMIEKIPHLSKFLESLYNCQYKEFFEAFNDLAQQIKLDRYLYPHFRYYRREVRSVAYSQFLNPYKRITIEAMANAFGVTEEFIERDLSHLIVAGKLDCKINKVEGMLETTHPDVRNALYQAIIKQGDLLLNRIENLFRVVHK